MMRLIGFVVLLLLASFISFGAADSVQLSPRELILQENYEEALERLQPRIEKSPTFSDLYNIGIVYAKTKKYRKSLWAFEAALKIDPSNSRARSNAVYVYNKLLPNSTWQNPFSWTERMIVAFRSMWIPLILISSLVAALSVFFWVSGFNIKWSWITKLWIPSLLLLALSLLGLNKLNEHATNHNYSIPTKNNIQPYLSPEGVPVKEEFQLSLRNSIVKYNQDSSWVCVVNNQERVWLKREDLFIY